jgi:hypothetical protein
MVDSAVLDRKELQRLADRIASARSEQKPAAHIPGSESGNVSSKGVK